VPRVVFQPMGVEVACAEGESLFEVARRHGVPVATACVGKATCGLCRMKVESGAEHLTPFNAGERKHLGNVYFITRERLACQARVQGAEATVVVRVALERLVGR
jgi:ferredoxin, 2Fe-2S